MGKILSIEDRVTSWHFWISIPKRFCHYLIPVGSIAVNGVSLTMAEVKEQSFAVSIIPHTMDVTMFKDLKPGDTVNLEFDVLGKYLERMLKTRKLIPSK